MQEGNPYAASDDLLKNPIERPLSAVSPFRGSLAAIVAAPIAAFVPLLADFVDIAITLAAYAAGAAFALFTPAHRVRVAAVCICLGLSTISVTFGSGILESTLGWEQQLRGAPDEFSVHRAALRTFLILMPAIFLTIWIVKTQTADSQASCRERDDPTIEPGSDGSTFGNRNTSF